MLVNLPTEIANNNNQLINESQKRALVVHAPVVITINQRVKAEGERGRGGREERILRWD